MTAPIDTENPSAAAAATPPAGTLLVQARDLAMSFDVSAPWLNRVLEGRPRQLLHAVDGVSFDIQKGQTLALVGESGCGKSTVARLLVGLYQPTRGGLTFDGQDAHAAFRRPEGRALRRRIQMIFQDPYASLNPRWTVEAIVGEPLREHGVRRLSVGIQSFDADALQRIGRVNDRQQALAAALAAAEHYPTFNLDLMYGLPGQDLAALRADLAQALAFSPPHLSYYNLTLEPNTLFASRPPEGLPDDDTVADMQQAIEAGAAACGLAHYEVSAYARAGHRARHNLNYWTFGDYLGLGAGAHGKLSFHDRIERTARLRHPRRYMEAALAGDAIETRRTLDADELPFEFMLNALRLVDGVSAASFAERTGLPLAAIARPLARAAERGLLDPDPGTIRPTPLGLRFLNDLQQMFLG
jgi:putative oxygen-independent coproporphyrinogen III oxidase